MQDNTGIYESIVIYVSKPNLSSLSIFTIVIIEHSKGHLSTCRFPGDFNLFLNI